MKCIHSDVSSASRVRLGSLEMGDTFTRTAPVKWSGNTGVYLIVCPVKKDRVRSVSLQSGDVWPDSSPDERVYPVEGIFNYRERM